MGILCCGLESYLNLEAIRVALQKGFIFMLSYKIHKMFKKDKIRS